jgi:hypothetical protein
LLVLLVSFKRKSAAKNAKSQLLQFRQKLARMDSIS